MAHHYRRDYRLCHANVTEGSLHDIVILLTLTASWSQMPLTPILKFQNITLNNLITFINKIQYIKHKKVKNKIIEILRVFTMLVLIFGNHTYNHVYNS